jgi:putative transposase
LNRIQRTYRFELRPNMEQRILLSKHFGCVRFVFNHFLNEKQEQYKEDGKSDNFYAQAKSLTVLKKQEGTVWLKEVNSQSLQHALKHLDVAYQNFFSGRAKFPRFKSKRSKQSFHVPQNVRLENNRLCIPKLKEGIKVIQHRELKGQIRNCTITRTATDRYFVSILCVEDYQPMPKTGAVTGIDLGLKDFVIT